MGDIKAAIKVAQASDSPNYSAIAKEFDVNRSTLSKRARGKTRARAKTPVNALLTRTQEAALIRYINKLTLYGFPPTPAQLRSFVEAAAHRFPNKNWVSAFVRRNSSKLEARYLAPLDSVRAKADSWVEYSKFFDTLEQKMDEYRILPENTYNVDEKGFMIGKLQRSKRVFTRKQAKGGKLRGNIQDGNREWITLLAAICGDGSVLEPGLIYSAKTQNMQDSWVADYTEQDQIWMAPSPEGWTSDELALIWLEKLFDRLTRDKAGRAWRLLILDGHGSHMKPEFIEYAIRNKICVMTFPPHTTHRLQPLDVSLFSSLAEAYSRALDKRLSASKGIIPMKKAYFLSVFKQTWSKTMTPEDVMNGWRKTGIFPPDRDVVLRQVTTSEDRHLSINSSQTNRKPSLSDSVVSAADWRKLKGILREVIADENAKIAEKLSRAIQQLTFDNAILKMENESLRQSLIEVKAHKPRQKTLVDELRAEDAQKAIFRSPQKIIQRKAIEERTEKEAENLERQKQSQRVQSQLLKEQRERDKQVLAIHREKATNERCRKREQEARAKEDRQADKAADAQLQNEHKTPHKTQKTRKIRPQKVAMSAADVVVVDVAESAQGTQTRAGRNIKQPKHLEDFYVG